jgi:hypothetical protein
MAERKSGYIKGLFVARFGYNLIVGHYGYDRLSLHSLLILYWPFNASLQRRRNSQVNALRIFQLIFLH